MICRYCNLPINGNPSTTFTYWGKASFPCHPECKTQGEASEALDCQLIDADCNDCIHFKRGPIANKIIDYVRTPDGRLEIVTFQPEWFHGVCQKFNKRTAGQPNKWSGLECFEHRKKALVANDTRALTDSSGSAGK